jgi:hypothetical protein
MKTRPHCNFAGTGVKLCYSAEQSLILSTCTSPDLFLQSGWQHCFSIYSISVEVLPSMMREWDLMASTVHVFLLDATHS